MKERRKGDVSIFGSVYELLKNRNVPFLLFAIFLIGIITFFSLSYWQERYPLFLEFYDAAYHASASVGLERAGGFTLTNFWGGYSPQGSTHFYLPFFHILGLLLLSIGATPFFLTYWLPWLLFPLSLISVFLFTYNTYGARTAVYTVALLSLSPIWMDKQWGQPPQGLVYVLTPLIFLALAKNRYIIVTVLVLCCMATSYTGILLFPFLILYALQNKNQRKPILIISAIILLASSPFIWLGIQRIIKGRFLFVALSAGNLEGSIAQSLKQLRDIKDSIHVYLGWLAIAGIIICYFRKGKFLILPSYFFASFPIAWTTQDIRFWGAPALFIFSILGGITISTLHEWVEIQRHGKIKGIAFFLAAFVVGNLLFYALSGLSPYLKTPTVIYLKSPAIWQRPRLTFSMDDRYKIIELVKKNVGDDEFFWISSSHNINNFVAANTKRSTVSSNAVGVMPAEGIRLVVDRKVPSADYIFLDKINEEFNAYILRQSAQAAKVSIPKPILKTKQLIFIFAFLGLLILSESKKGTFLFFKIL